MKWTTLTIDIERGFLANPVATGARVRRFLTRAFTKGIEERKFHPSWKGEPLWARRDGEKLVLRSHGLSQWARVGDRLWLQAAVGEPSGHVSLYDGSAVMVQHFLARADPEFAGRLALDGLPPDDSAEIGAGNHRAEWSHLLTRAVRLAAEYEARSTASLAALVNFGAKAGAEVRILARGEREYPARATLTELIASARAGRQLMRPEQVDGAPPEPYELDPQADTPRLLDMVEAVAEAFEEGEADTKSASETIADMLRSVASGRPYSRGE